MGAVGDDVALNEAAQGHVQDHEHRRGRRTDAGLAVVVLVILAAAALRPLLQDLFDRPAVAHWATIFVAITVQAMPFLALGITVSAAIAAFVPDDFLPRALPKRPALAVPVAAVAGAALPGCECGSVPIAGRLVSRGALPAAALAFLLSAPAINPVVLVATSVAFPGRPEMVLARFAASLSTAVLVGWVWARFGRRTWMRSPRRPSTDGLGRAEAFRATMAHDFLRSGGYL